MTILLIILLILIIIYLVYQNRKLTHLSRRIALGVCDINGRPKEIPTSTSKDIVFDQDQEDLIADRDQAIRQKNEAEQEALDFSNKLKLKVQEVNRKDSEIERLKSEKNLVEVNLNKKLTENKQQQTEQLRQINLLFDPQAKDYKSIDFNGLYNLLTQIAQQNKDLPGSFPKGDN